jgi:hypothetical protein
MESFRILSAEGIRVALAAIERRWDASPAELERFRAWAWVVAAVSETYASEDLGACAELLKDEHAALHRVIAERLHYVSDISSELVSKRAFLEHLERELVGEPSRVSRAA